MFFAWQIIIYIWPLFNILIIGVLIVNCVLYLGFFFQKIAVFRAALDIDGTLSQLTVCSYHVMYAFESESTLHSCLNVKELLARSRREIWRLSDCNWTQTQNHLVLKRRLNHLAKLAKLLILLMKLTFETNACPFKRWNNWMFY